MATATRTAVLGGMLAGAALLSLANLAVRFLDQPDVAVDDSSQVDSTVRSAGAHDLGAAPPRPARTADRPATPGHGEAIDDQRAALEDETARQAELISNAADYTLAAAFPADLPQAHTPAVFRGVIDDAMRSCMTNAEVVALSCDEPPCLAAIRVPASDRPPAVFDCPAWQRVYGRSLGVGGFNTVDCGDGRQEMVEVIAPDLESWEGWQRLDADTRRHIEARHDVRVTNLLAALRCRPRA